MDCAGVCGGGSFMEESYNAPDPAYPDYCRSSDCPALCEAGWIGDDYCDDAECNNPECN